MRPVTLTMKAFGSFAQRTTVPFADFQSGLYLVVGETGAGKTTIFDAIVFALFGAASGSSRKPDMMHSDFVDKSEDTEVSLVFDHGGRRYTVTRTIHFRKKRGTQDAYSEGALTAELILPDGSPVSGHTAVTRRCEELLGLSADQFRKIVMLAQGEFREFLAADSAKKSDILGRLFDSSAYVRYQNLLGGARSALDARRRQHRETVDAVMRTTFRAPEDEAETDAFAYSANNPNLIVNLDRLIGREQERTAELSERKADAQRVVDSVNTRKGAAESVNRQFDELLAAQRHAEALDAQRGEMERRSAQYAQAEQALHKVCPVRDRYCAAAETVERARSSIAALRAREAVLRNDYEEAEADAASDADAKNRLREIDTERRIIEESLPRYDTLARKRSELEETMKTVSGLRERLRSAEARREESRAALDAGQFELRELENAEADAVRARAEYDAARKNSEELRGADGICDVVASVAREETALAAEEAKLSRLTAEAAEAENTHHRLYQAFLSGQAGLMAAELRAELERNGTAFCPVCRAEYRAGTAHNFARYAEGTPKQTAVDEAKRRCDSREKSRAAQQSVVERRRAELDSRRTAAVARAKKLLPDCGDWAALSAPGTLDAAVTRFERAERDAKTVCDDARRRRERRLALKADCERLAGELETLNRAIDSDQAAKGEMEKQTASLCAEVAGLTANLPFASRGETEKRYRALAQERGLLEERIDSHQNALNAAKEAIDTTRGELAGKERALPEQEAAETAARSAYEAALSASGFSGEDALAASLAPLGDADGEDWLRRQREALNAYRNDCANTAERIGTLAEQTRGKSRTDPAALLGELAEAQARRDAAEQAYAGQEKLLDNHRGVRERVAASLNELAKTDAAWRRLDRLADLALGANAEGGKLSFERYVMGAIFREVLEMANRRLDVMSGGRYALVHSLSAGRANAAAGLEIEVLDAATLRQRPANSLSGGESFQVSLSLALGLSDVVQGHAGGIGLDTIFIDEGFGALDGGALDNAITVLNQLTEGNRLVGIISHVDKLEESIPQKLRVRKTPRGSELHSELS